MNYNYSIIIPHKNIPKLLQRSLDSIPDRDDVQIIVVDDNSDPDIVDFNLFPGSGRKNTELYFTKEGKGAGYARNVGLDHAIGKWLLFLDADDFLSENAGKILDDNIDSPYDIIFYDNKTVMSDDISQKSIRDSFYHSYFQCYLEGFHDEGLLRYCFQPLWGKIIRYSLVLDNHIKFDEVRWSNDVFFSCQVGVYAKSIYVNNDILYVVTQRSGSLTSIFCGTAPEFIVRLKEAIISEKFMSKHGIDPPRLQSDSIVRRYYNEHGIKQFIITMMTQSFFSDIQKKMLKFLFKVFHERIIREIK